FLRPLGLRLKFIQDKSIRENIEVTGELPKLEEPKLQIDKKMLSHMTPESEELTEESDIESELFELLAWHVDEVTDGGKSLEKTKGKGVKIALIDSGVDTNHPVLEGKINLGKGKSYVEGDTSITDLNSHGTATAGVIAQIAPEATITPYKVLGAKDGESIWTIAAIVDAVKDGNDVINMSLGSYKCLDDSDERILINAFKRAVRYAENNGVEVFASSGNKSMDLDLNLESKNEIHLPGEINGVNTISASWNSEKASYSNYGTCVDYSAPGGELVIQNGMLNVSACIYIAYPTYMDNGLEAAGIPQGYTFSYGTSLSSAISTACFADVYSYGKNQYQYFDKDDAINVLTAGSKDLGPEGKDVHFGNGEINIYSAISKMAPVYEGEITEEDEQSRTYSKNDITAEYSITDEYEDKYHVRVTLKNNTQKTINKWKIAMDYKDEIDSIWDGEVSKDGNYTIISNAKYNQDIKPGETVSFGFIARHTSEESIFPKEIVMVNRSYMLKSEDYSVDYDVTSKWDDGFIGNVTITNNSNQTIEDWKIEFTYDANIGSIWNAAVDEKDDDYYSIINAEHNQNILPGETVTFGFKAQGSSEELMENISLMSISK
ncbi:cellulose binding domain-containing protein, partial [Pseudobutyrivibrio sp.]